MRDGLTAIKEIGQALDLQSPAARLKACTTIQFSKSHAHFEGERKYYRRIPALSTVAALATCYLSTEQR
jgi:hypothetical protein